jgi:hypothetical protein
MVIYKIFVFGTYRKSNMAARAHNVFWLVEILKIFLLKTTKPIELWLCRNDIGSYVKTMSADSGHLGWRFGSLDIILKVDHLRTIHAMFALNWLTGFRGEDFNLKQTWHEWSLNGQLSKLYPVIQTSIQDGHYQQT